MASSFILPPIFSTTITPILPERCLFFLINIVKIPFASPNIRWHKDTKYCLSTSYKIRVFWVTKSGPRTFLVISTNAQEKPPTHITFHGHQSNQKSQTSTSQNSSHQSNSCNFKQNWVISPRDFVKECYYLWGSCHKCIFLLRNLNGLLINFNSD